MPAAWRPIRFIDDEVDVEFDHPPALSKKPGPPDRFHWDCEEFHITDLVSAWVDFGRRGDMARNMAPAHREVAQRMRGVSLICTTTAPRRLQGTGKASGCCGGR